MFVHSAVEQAGNAPVQCQADVAEQPVCCHPRVHSSQEGMGFTSLLFICLQEIDRKPALEAAVPVSHGP